MESTDILGLGILPTYIGLIVSFLSFILYWATMVLKKWKEKKEVFDFNYWWSNNWMPFLVSVLASVILFLVFWAKGELTVERCLLIGSASAFFIERLSKMK